MLSLYKSNKLIGNLTDAEYFRAERIAMYLSRRTGETIRIDDERGVCALWGASQKAVK